MISFCKAIKFAVEDRLFSEKYEAKSAKSQENLPKMVWQEKMPKRAKSQEKIQATKLNKIRNIAGMGCFPFQIVYLVLANRLSAIIIRLSHSLIW